MKRAEINKDYRVHFVFEAEDYPDPPWPPYDDGDIPLIVDLTGDNEGAQEGDGYNPITEKIVFTPSPIYKDYSDVKWDKNNFSFLFLFLNEKGEDDTVLIEDIIAWINEDKRQS